MKTFKGRKRNLKTVRQMADQKSSLKKRPSAPKNILRLIFLPFKLIFRWLNKPVQTHADSSQNPLMENLTKQRSMTPAYVRESVVEMKAVTWPSFSVAMRLTVAVFLFAIFFALLIFVLDWILTQVFEEIILNKAENLKDLF